MKTINVAGGIELILAIGFQFFKLKIANTEII
jgi:hypothetical protein